MINFRLKNEKQLFGSFADLMDLVRDGDFAGCQIGPFEDFCLLKLGIIIDGRSEVRLAEAFEKVLKRLKYLYERNDTLGEEFYLVREY